MEHSRIIIETDNLICYHLSKDDMNDTSLFTPVNNESGFLSLYIKKQAFIDEENHNARTYIVRDKQSNELVAYFSLKAGFVSVNERRIIFNREFDSVPGVEISNFAINGLYRKKHPTTKYIGNTIFQNIIKPIIYQAAEDIGIRIIYIFALPHKDLIDYYRDSFGFTRLNRMQEHSTHKRIRPAYDRDCIFMYQNI